MQFSKLNWRLPSFNFGHLFRRAFSQSNKAPTVLLQQAQKLSQSQILLRHPQRSYQHVKMERALHDLVYKKSPAPEPTKPAPGPTKKVWADQAYVYLQEISDKPESPEAHGKYQQAVELVNKLRNSKGELESPYDILDDSLHTASELLAQEERMGAKEIISETLPPDNPHLFQKEVVQEVLLEPPSSKQGEKELNALARDLKEIIRDPAALGARDKYQQAVECVKRLSDEGLLKGSDNSFFEDLLKDASRELELEEGRKKRQLDAQARDLLINVLSHPGGADAHGNYQQAVELVNKLRNSAGQLEGSDSSFEGLLMAASSLLEKVGEVKERKAAVESLAALYA